MKNVIKRFLLFSLNFTLILSNPVYASNGLRKEEATGNIMVSEHQLTKSSKHYQYLWKEKEEVPKDAKVYVYTPPNFNGKTVCIDAGHGDNTKPVANLKKEKYYPIEDSKLKTMNTSMVGAKAYGYGVESRSFPNIYDKKETEPEFTLKVAVLAKDMLLDKGYRVVMTRNSFSQNLSNGTRAVLAAETSDIMVSIHSNASVSHRVRGCIVYYGGDEDSISGEVHPGYTKIMGIDKYVTDSANLSRFLARSVSEKGGFINKGEQTAVLRLFSYSSIPTALVEVGFSDQMDDAKLLVENKKKIAEGIVTGIDSYYKNKMK